MNRGHNSKLFSQPTFLNFLQFEFITIKAFINECDESQLSLEEENAAINIIKQLCISVFQVQGNGPDSHQRKKRKIEVMVFTSSFVDS
jgi:hypothetical protein